MTADFAGSITEFTIFAIAAFFCFMLWKGGLMISRAMVERNLILRGFLDKPDDDDFAAHMRNYFTWHKFGFRTDEYYSYFDDEERFCRYFRKQLYPPYWIVPVFTAAAALVYLPLMGKLCLDGLIRRLDQPLSEFFSWLSVFIFIFAIALAPLFFLPVWKAARARWKLVREMDQRYRRIRAARASGPDAQAQAPVD